MISAIAIILLSGDRRELVIPEICIGYVSDGGTVLLEHSAHSGFDGENIALKVYVYTSEEAMIDDLCADGIDVAFLENKRILFENQLPSVRMILEFRADSYGDIAVCVKESMLEDELDLLFCFARVMNVRTLEEDAIELLKPDEWIRAYLDQGYEENRIMDYLVPDFQMEVLRQ